MGKLAQEIARYIAEHVRAAISRLQGPSSIELRTVFHGPPGEYLGKIFEVLTADENGIRATLGNGTEVTVPVLLQVDQLEDGASNPPIGSSGKCEANYLLTLRNSPATPRFIALLPPGQGLSLSLASTIDEFGLSAENNAGTATIDEWWQDAFVQQLVESAFSRYGVLDEQQKNEARKLFAAALRDTDNANRHDPSRNGSWRLLSRLWSISDRKLSFGTQVSLVCGYPPFEDGTVDADDQAALLEDLAGRLEEGGFKLVIDQLKERAGSDEEEAQALDQVLGQLQMRCEIPTAFARAASFYYCPLISDQFEEPPSWWTFLTVEKWHQLLEHEILPRTLFRIECVNGVVPPVRGMPAIVLSEVQLLLTIPDGVALPLDVTVLRQVPGQELATRAIAVTSNTLMFTESELAPHRSPCRFTAEALGIKKASIRVVALETWEPGIIVHARTASKATLPKRSRDAKEKVAFESSLVLIGQGRHYIDIFTRPGVVVDSVARGSDESGAVDPEKGSPIVIVSDNVLGFEADASGECFYEFSVTRDDEKGPEVFRVYITCDETTPEECSSEFERLIRVNRQGGSGRGTTDVTVDRLLRSADLQTWMLASENVERSFLPLVLARDYAHGWHSPRWESAPDTILSGGRFLHDPRPEFQDLQPPPAFLEARKEIALRVRGKDENGLVEAAKLGEWLIGGDGFAEILDSYVRSFLAWLESDPDAASWCDLAIVNDFEADDVTFVQDPDAIIVSPLHPLRLAWHALAQRALFLAHRHLPCPAASILDPDVVPDALVLPLRSATGMLKHQVFFSVECSSDYWGILWNASNIQKIKTSGNQAPFDKEFGLLIGGMSSGFSVSQVHRALDDVSEILQAKPVLNLLVNSASGQNNACNEGIISWCRDRLGNDEQDERRSLGTRLVQVLDERNEQARPEDAEISNLAEDTDNSVRWYGGSNPRIQPDLGIIAQLDTSNAGFDVVKVGSPLASGGLLRYRIRQQLQAGSGAFLSETRMAGPRPPIGDALADRVMAAIGRLENLGDSKYGYTFAPSVHAIQSALKRADFAAVSSTAVDPACFLGQWLEGSYLWDYDLPSYSHRSGDNNGYYLLSQVKDVDREALTSVLSRLPGCDNLAKSAIDQVILEVSRRGIPTVRGLSRGDSGASGDLGLFIAARLIQDEFRSSPGPENHSRGLLPIWTRGQESSRVALLIPVDPFRGYLGDLGRAIGSPTGQRPDLLVAGIFVSDSLVSCRLTPVEVKYRGGKDTMAISACRDALQQAVALSGLLQELHLRSAEPELMLWKIAYQHLLSTMLGFGFRVYSQQALASREGEEWSRIHSRVIEAILSEEARLEIDATGRLVVIDGSASSAPRDHDGDDFLETLVIGRADAATIASGDPSSIYADAINGLGHWRLFPADSELPSKPHGEDKKPGEVTAPPVRETEPSPVEIPGGPVTVTKEVASTTPSKPIEVTAEVGLKTRSADSETTTQGLHLQVGNTVDGFRAEVRKLNLSDTKLNQLNMGVVGDLGTGKTQLLKSFIYQASRGAPANRGIQPRFLIFDYKKDYSSDDFVKAVGARVVSPRHLPFNIFDIAGAGNSLTPWLDRFKFFSDVLDKIYSGVGPVQRQNLKKAVRKAYDRAERVGAQPTIYDVHAEYQLLLGEKVDAPLSIIGDIVDMELFSAKPTGIAGFEQFLDGVVVIALSELGGDDRTKNMLVAIMLNLFYEHMLRIPKRPYSGSEPQLRAIDSFLLVDEADNIMRYEFDVLRRILLQGREFGVGVILASQYLKHFKAGGTDYREPLLTWFIHKLPNLSAQELGSLGLAGELAQLADRVKSLGNHQCLFKTFNVAGEIVAGTPFFDVFARLHSTDPLPS